jgi:hypothetical protein
VQETHILDVGKRTCCEGMRRKWWALALRIVNLQRYTAQNEINWKNNKKYILHKGNNKVRRGNISRKVVGRKGKRQKEGRNKKMTQISKKCKKCKKF